MLYLRTHCIIAAEGLLYYCILGLVVLLYQRAYCITAAKGTLYCSSYRPVVYTAARGLLYYCS